MSGSHILMLVNKLPNISISQFLGYLKGKSSLMILIDMRT